MIRIVIFTEIDKCFPFIIIANVDIYNCFKIKYKVSIVLTKTIISKNKVIHGGSIFFIVSVFSIVGIVKNWVYAGIKNTLIDDSKIITLDLAKNMIRVNYLSPALNNEDLFNAGIDKGGISRSDYNKDISQHPLGLGEPVDVANLCVFLLSEGSKWITGSNSIIDGGYTLL